MLFTDSQLQPPGPNPGHDVKQWHRGRCSDLRWATISWTPSDLFLIKNDSNDAGITVSLPYFFSLILPIRSKLPHGR